MLQPQWAPMQAQPPPPSVLARVPPSRLRNLDTTRFAASPWRPFGHRKRIVVRRVHLGSDSLCLLPAQTASVVTRRIPLRKGFGRQACLLGTGCIPAPESGRHEDPSGQQNESLPGRPAEMHREQRSEVRDDHRPHPAPGAPVLGDAHEEGGAPAHHGTHAGEETTPPVASRGCYEESRRDVAGRDSQRSSPRHPRSEGCALPALGQETVSIPWPSWLTQGGTATGKAANPRGDVSPRHARLVG